MLRIPQSRDICYQHAGLILKHLSFYSPDLLPWLTSTTWIDTLEHYIIASFCSESRAFSQTAEMGTMPSYNVGEPLQGASANGVDMCGRYTRI